MIPYELYTIRWTTRCCVSKGDYVQCKNDTNKWPVEIHCGQGVKMVSAAQLECYSEYFINTSMRSGAHQRV